MPRPDKNSSVQILINTTRDTEDWTAKHEAAFATLEPQERPQPAGLADTLEARDRAWQNEQRDDVQFTANRDDFLDRTRRYLGSVGAYLHLASAQQTRREQRTLLRHFTPIAPSRIRNLSRAQKALRTIRAALDKRGDIFPTARRDRLLVEATTLEAEAVTLNRLQATEEQETSQAREQRDRAVQATDDHLRLCLLSATALSYEHPEVLRDLEVVFELRNPRSANPSLSSEPLDPDDDQETPEDLDLAEP